MRFATVLKTFIFRDLATPQQGSSFDRVKKSKELREWDEVLLSYYKQGYKIENSGTITSATSNEVIFWALLYKC
jgi:hypothetical protein